MIDIRRYIATIDRKLLYKLGGIFALYLIFFTVFFFPAIKDYKALLQKKKGNKRATQNALKKAKEFTSLSQQRLNAELLLREVSDLIPTDNEARNHLSEISELATVCDVKILEILPQDKNIVENKRLDEYCDRQGLQLDLECGYHQLAKFISKLETHKYLIQILSLKMIPGEKAVKRHLARLELVVVSKKKGFLEVL
ncbi:type 4a pilus biogenesis protein PilO [Candidatus Omnitrophota bacterium]